MLPTCAYDQIRVSELETGQSAYAVIVVGPADKSVIALQLNAGEIAAGDEVGNTGNSIGAVCRARAILQDFDPFKREERHKLRVCKAFTRRCDGPLAIEQCQRACRAKTTQVDGANTAEPLGGGRKLVGITKNRANRRQFLDELERAVHSLLREVFRREHIHRKRRIFGSSANERAGDDDFLVGILPLIRAGLFGL